MTMIFKGIDLKKWLSNFLGDAILRREHHRKKLTSFMLCVCDQSEQQLLIRKDTDPYIVEILQQKVDWIEQ
jgi:hypothetical protein